MTGRPAPGPIPHMAHDPDPRDDDDLVRAAQTGDRRAFERLWHRHRPAVHLHCYRLLGSVHEAEDATQDTMVRAWRRLARFERRSAFGTWLYRIATNVCLNVRERRPVSTAPVGPEVPHLTPYPDVLLRAAAAADPAARTDELAGVELAFVTAVQLLPPRQRAVLVLREALGWPVAEVAQFLGTTEASVNSAAQRARATLAECRRRGELRPPAAAAPDARTAETVRRYMAAWAAVDLDALAGLLR